MPGSASVAAMGRYACARNCVNEGCRKQTWLRPWQEMDIDWYAVATDAIHKKFGTLDPIDLKEKARRARFMQYRGFAAQHYQRLLND